MGFEFKFPKYSENWESISNSCKQRDGFKCRQCGALGKRLGGDATLQACHLISKRNGGKDVLANLITKCVKCHAQEDGHGHMKSNPQFKKQIKQQKKKWNF